MDSMVASAKSHFALEGPHFRHFRDCKAVAFRCTDIHTIPTILGKKSIPFYLFIFLLVLK